MDIEKTLVDWKIKERPPSMPRRYDFDDYESVSQLLDALAAISEQTGFHPNLNFTRTHVNVSISTDEDALGDDEYQFAAKAEALFVQQTA